MKIPTYLTIVSALISSAWAEKKKDVSLLENEKLNFIQEVEVHGDNPQVIYVPIIHDGPMNQVSDTNLDNLRLILKECEQISAHLYEGYGVRNILLEGCGKSVADSYKKFEGTTKKISFKHTKMVTFETWGNILNERRWELAFTGKSPIYGPLTVLGGKYDQRIKGALSAAKDKGFFRSQENFTSNEKEFKKLLADATAGYNEKRATILKNDPKLKEEYRLTVSQRDLDFIENITAKDGPGIIMCGVGHYHDLKEQLKKRGDSFMIVVPKSLAWPVAKKTEEEIYQDMLKQGCKLKKCSLTFGDGVKATIQIPVD